MVIDIIDENNSNSKVLRLAKTSEVRIGDFDDEWAKVPRDFLKDTVEGHYALDECEILHPKIFSDDINKSKNDYGEYEYVVAEKVAIDFSYREFFNDIKNKKDLLVSPKLKLSNESIEKIMNDLNTFLITTYKLTSIGDLHTDNLVYSKEKWMVLDYTSDIKRYYHLRSDINEHILKHFPMISDDWAKKLSSSIVEKRKLVFNKVATATATNNTNTTNVKNHSSCQPRVITQVNRAPLKPKKRTNLFSQIFGLFK
ncbi:MAG: hypothetical protein HQK49_19940 [Oligoflexia bacterium]|nr:hypothetical protein [Oligoflexia bacterium]